MTNQSTAVGDLLSDDLWLSHFACVPWSSPDCWVKYFSGVQTALHAHITHLDESDPVRRRVDQKRLENSAALVCSFGQEEESRTIFGRMNSIGVRFTIYLHTDLTVWTNSVKWYFPTAARRVTYDFGDIRALFDLGNRILSPFYSYADYKHAIMEKKKHSGRAIDLQRELAGVFWLTCFSRRYVHFIGETKVRGLPAVDLSVGEEGATLSLGASPDVVFPDARSQCEVALGQDMFVDPSERFVRRPGQYVLSFDKLVD